MGGNIVPKSLVFYQPRVRVAFFGLSRLSTRSLAGKQARWIIHIPPSLKATKQVTIGHPY